MSSFSHSDATPTYRGYRLQLLYTLWRILSENKKNNFTFQPEGQEDLAIYDEAGHLIEIIQVKARSENISLSSFSPKKVDSFFNRSHILINSTSSLKTIRVISFGCFGQDFEEACNGNINKLKAESEKLSNYGHLSSEEAEKLLKKINLETVTEENLEKEALGLLKQGLAGIDYKCAFDIITYWLYICAENQIKITYQSITEKLNKIGEFLVERTTYHKEWFTSILPIENNFIDEQKKEYLSHEFYRGISARYEHILANVDVIRKNELEKISQEFNRNKVVIIHGASGQGKTTLAYRYLHEFHPEQWRFKIQLIENRQHSLSIARAIEGYAKAIGIPIIMYLDVSHNDNGWTDLVKQLASYQNIYVLVTVREEDYRRASVSGTEFPFSDIELTFDANEAKEIYQSLVEKKATVEFLNFEEAWDRFYQEHCFHEKLLMEFVFLITKGQFLKQRLLQQVRRLEDEVRIGKFSNKELEFLKLVSIASAFEARLDVKSLVKFLNLPVPRRTIELLEKEYLLKCSDDGSLIYGMHPIRSQILSDILTDPSLSAWSESAIECFPFIIESDMESFLLYSFSRKYNEIRPLVNSLMFYQPKYWSGIAGINKALIWLGIKDYVEENKALIQTLHSDLGSGFWILLSYDITDAMTDSESSIWQCLRTIVPESYVNEIENLQSQQTDKSKVFQYSKKWLSNIIFIIEQPFGYLDWQAMSEVFFWLGRLQIDFCLDNLINKIDFNNLFQDLPIDVLADLILGLSFGYEEKFNIWMNTHRMQIVQRFRQETQTIILEDDNQKLTAHFLIPTYARKNENSFNNSIKREDESELHQEAMWRIDLLRKLLPDRQLYACCGYGHRMFTEELPYDETVKTGIAKENLPVTWLTSINSTFTGIADQFFKPQNWSEYSTQVIRLRTNILNMLGKLDKGLINYFRQSQAFNWFDKYINPPEWRDCKQQLVYTPLLPACSANEWGFNNKNDLFLSNKNNALAFQDYSSYLKVFREYHQNLYNFFNQAEQGMVITSALGRKEDKERVLEIAKSNNLDPKLSHIAAHNLANTLKGLKRFQQEFRRKFSSYLDLEKLKTLESKELETFNNLCCLWLFFAFYPGKHFQDPIKECHKEITDKLKKIRNKLKKEFCKISNNNLSVQILSENVLWEHDKTLWITIDGSNPIEVYIHIVVVIKLLTQAINVLGNTPLRRYILDLNWTYVAIIPLVKGKSLQGTASHIYIHTLVYRDEEELNWWNYAQKEIPKDAISHLSIERHAEYLLKNPNHFLTSFTSLKFLLAHIKDLNRMPKNQIDNFAFKQLKNYFDELEESWLKILDFSYNSLERLENLKEETSLDNLQKYDLSKDNLEEFINILKEIFFSLQNLTKTTAETILLGDTQNIDNIFSTICTWSHTLEQVENYIFLIYFIWIAEILDNSNNIIEFNHASVLSS
ncbi:hypothetical protein PCC8801_2996 [Rippkaea orientalis PCC 8801]|uniref:Novel STAND NTPase 3 domain-containing protein n=1 Tax=Rippkaea orientalis (strain PCC 8801 / RF-1) TaxID=41431 RepID=B7JWD8_RIPO1|nr:hypothetical protein [Rippkaea orientalis]ACK66983.1 hypothetical protein PCC8801_2996 [Rippkaea orientalis PCC 8801]